MKLRYQMRGLGIGIIVTALLMGVAVDDKVSLSDAEIKLLAAELGMVESDSLKLSDVQTSGDAVSNQGYPDGGKESENSEGSTVNPTGAPTTEPTGAPTADPTTKPTEAPTAEPTMEPTAEPTEIPTKEPAGESATIVVIAGTNSYTVSKQLAEAGLVQSADEYDRYLCNNGYAERIQVGTFEIPMGSTGEEIAKIITKFK